MNFKYKLGFIGCGNMAKAIIDGILAKGFLSENEILISRATKGNERVYKNIEEVYDNNDIVQNCEYTILAIKPQVFRQIKNSFSQCKSICIISLMAGVTNKEIYDTFKTSVIRTMPNTATKVDMGMTGIELTSCDAKISDFVKNIFSCCGETECVEEKDLHSVIGVSGSGIAYVYTFIKSMIDGGISNGLSAEKAEKLALQTFSGAVKMIKNRNCSIEDLIKAVCSKGGTTIQAIDYFKEIELSNSIQTGMNKVIARSKALENGEI